MNNENNYYISRILILGQKLPGLEKKFERKKSKRIYRPGLCPKSYVREKKLTEVIEEKSLEIKKIHKKKEFKKIPVVELFNKQNNTSNIIDLYKIDVNKLSIPKENDFQTDIETDRRRKQALTRARKRSRKDSIKQKNNNFITKQKKIIIRKDFFAMKMDKIKCLDNFTTSKDESIDVYKKNKNIKKDLDFQKRKIKLFFIPKKKRNKNITETFDETEERITIDEKKQRKLNRKKQIRKRVINYIEMQDQEKFNEYEMPNDDDKINKEQEFELWKLREMKRLKRIQNLIDEEEKEKLELSVRREMTDEEIKYENLQIPKLKERSKMKFLQKYFHKGSFFEDDSKSEKLLKRNFNVAVGSDKWINYDDPNLPEPMKVKHFGHSSQTKYTHLMDQDTTRNYLADVEVDEYELDNIMITRKNLRLGGFNNIKIQKKRKYLGEKNI